MKRIGILTFHFSNHNFGALLQTYASVIVLRNLGYRPRVINLISEEVIESRTFSQKVLSIIFGNPFESFRKKHLPLTKFIKSTELESLNSVFDAFYVGSDQVWREEFAGENLIHYFLDFADDSKYKISYAASFGKENIDYDTETKAKVAKLIKRFDAISVREDSGVEICRTEFGVNAEKVLDPTMMLDEVDYDAIIKSKPIIKNDKYIAYYELGYSTSVSNRAMEFVTNFKLPVRNIYRQEINLLIRKITPFNTVSNWLNSIKQAELVITNSYHCVIFSILYKRNFIVLTSEYGGNSRVKSLLNDLGLSNRLFDNYDTENFNRLQPINYEIVFEKLNELRKRSYKYLEVLN